MRGLAKVLTLLVGITVNAAEVDRFCLRDVCQALVVRGNSVRFIDGVFPPRDLLLGPYLEQDQHLVPGTEAPIRELRSISGWRAVISALLNHEEGGAELRLRLIARTGKASEPYDLMMSLEQAELGYLFGGRDDILAITSAEEHVYNAETIIWLLPNYGQPRELLRVHGVVDRFVSNTASSVRGVWVSRETYDGINSSSKGKVPEFWRWNPNRKTLSKAMQ